MINKKAAFTNQNTVNFNESSVDEPSISKKAKTINFDLINTKAAQSVPVATLESIIQFALYVQNLFPVLWLQNLPLIDFLYDEEPVMIIHMSIPNINVNINVQFTYNSLGKQFLTSHADYARTCNVLGFSYLDEASFDKYLFYFSQLLKSNKDELLTVISFNLFAKSQSFWNVGKYTKGVYTVLYDPPYKSALQQISSSLQQANLDDITKKSFDGVVAIFTDNKFQKQTSPCLRSTISIFKQIDHDCIVKQYIQHKDILL